MSATPNSRLVQVAPRHSLGFVSALIAADVGMKLSYTPVLTILLPLRMAALAHAAGPVAFSLATLAGAAAASAVNLGAGALADRGGTGGGRDRRPWLLAGLAAVMVGYAALAAARTVLELGAALVALQVAVNLTLSSCTAMIAERFFRRSVGVVVGAAGLAQPVATLAGGALTAVLIPFGPVPYVALAGLTAMLILPFGLLPPPAPGEAPDDPPAAGPAPSPAPRGFASLWAWKFCLAMSATLSAPYLLFRLAAEPHGAATTAAVEVSWLTAFSALTHMAAAVLLARAMGRRLDRRAVAGLAAAAWAAAMALFLLAHGLPALAVAFALLGAANGVQQSADVRLWIDLLPSRRTLGRDLGVLNLANTTPQMLAPALAMLSPGLSRGDVGGLFALALLAAACGGAAAASLGGGRRQPTPH